VRDLPKVELHLHLEGAAPPALIRDMARRARIDIGGIFDAESNYAFRDFAHFLKVYEAATSVLTTPDAYYRLTRAVLGESAQNGVIYTEAFLSPDFCGGADLHEWRDHLAAIATAAAEAEAEDGIAMRAIVTCIRHFGPAQARATALCAAETAGDFVTGFGIAGAETVHAPRDFAYAFDMAREAGLGITAHAGEWAGPESVRAALADLRPARIGHGVRAIEDPRLVEELAERGTVLEVCPGSNIALGLYPRWRDHPIGPFHDRGLRVTVSTDDPPFFRTSMRREYDRLADAFGWDEGVFTTLARTAAEAAFCDDATRARILKRLDKPHD
jgi:adenosine deaminase